MPASFFNSKNLEHKGATCQQQSSTTVACFWRPDTRMSATLLLIRGAKSFKTNIISIHPGSLCKCVTRKEYAAGLQMIKTWLSRKGMFVNRRHQQHTASFVTSSSSSTTTKNVCRRLEMQRLRCKNCLLCTLVLLKLHQLQFCTLALL